MPVLELLFFGVGISVGGKRAWRKLTGMPDSDDEEQGVDETSQRGGGHSPGSPMSPRSPRSPREMKSDRPVDDGVDPGLRLLMSDAVNLVSPRSGRPPNSDWLGSPRSTSSSPRSWAEVSPRSPRTVHGRESPRGDGGNATERGGKFWDFLLNAASPQASSPGGEAADDWESGLRRALHALAGDGSKAGQGSSQVPSTPASNRSEWNSAMTPRASVLKGGEAYDYSPRVSSSKKDGRRLRFAESPGVQTFVESHLELQSRKKHWEKILKKAEKEAFEAYLANDRRSNGGVDGRREQAQAKSRGKSQSPLQMMGGRHGTASSPSNGTLGSGRAEAQRGGGGGGGGGVNNGFAGEGLNDSPLSRSPPTSSLRAGAGSTGSPVPKLNFSALGGK